MGVSQYKSLSREFESEIRERRPNDSEEEVEERAQHRIRAMVAGALVDRSDPDPVIILKRNQKLLTFLDDYLKKPGNTATPIAICYGVGHAEDLVKHLERAGWRIPPVAGSPSTSGPARVEVLQAHVSPYFFTGSV